MVCFKINLVVFILDVILHVFGSDMGWSGDPIGPMHEEGFLGGPPNNTNCLVFVFITKSADSTVLTVFETLKNIDFH